MNKLRYRLVFNRARGQLMAVAETARADGKGAQGASAAGPAREPGRKRRAKPRLRRATLLLAGAFGAALMLAEGALAQVVADHGAPGNQQPTVLATANGVIQINLQTPSAAGVSRNTYSQFDVPRGGVILNNSRTNAQSQLGGYVQANPWLGTGPARVILNEVRSNQPSRLTGYIEVAGPRAEVIVANPAGINVDGAGFINVNRATLTTGTPIINGGALDGYSVRRGMISVDGTGLDASGTDFTNLIARSVALNAGVWARRLALTTGVNRVGFDNGNAVAGDGDGVAPRIGIDVSQLGGMYAHKITLLGTEAGVGVRNAGSIGAAAGEVIVTTAGRLENSGDLAATGGLRLRAQGVSNSGAIHGDAAIAIASGADLFNGGSVYTSDALTLNAATNLSNRGTLSGQRGLRATAASLANSGMIHSDAKAVLTLSEDAGNVGGSVQAAHIDLRSAAGVIDNSGGKIVQTGAGGLDIGATTLINGAGGKVGAPAAASGAGTGTGTGDIADTMATPVHTGGGGGVTGATPAVNGMVRAATITNNGGQISAGGAIGVTVQALDNGAGELNLERLAVVGGEVNNRLGKLTVQADFTTRGTALANQGGSVLVGGTFDAQVGGIDNRAGVLQAAHMRLASTAALDNTGGVLRQTGATEARWSVAGQLTNELGKIETAGDLALSAGAIAGSGGALTTLGDLRLDSGLTSTVKGNWIVNGDASLRGTAFDNGGGRLSVGKNLSLVTAALSNVAGVISAGAGLTLDAAGALDNRRGHLQAGTDLQLTTAGTLSNDAGAIDTRAAGTAMRVRARDIDNDGGRIVNVGRADTLIASAGTIINGGTLAGNGKLRIDAATLENRAGANVLAVGQLDLNVTQQLDNLGGTISSGGALNVTQASAGLRNSGQIGAGAKLTLHAAALDNDGGTIATTAFSGADLLIEAANLRNRHGAIVADRRADLGTAGAIDNSGGTLQAREALTLSAAGALDNTGGAIETVAAAGTLNLSAASIVNGNGRIINAGAGDTMLAGNGAIDNAGRIAGNGKLTLSAQTLRNRNGASIASAAALALAVHQQLDNAGGTISAGSSLTVDQAGTTLNNSGQIVGGGTLSLAGHVLNNDGGRIATAGHSGADVLLRADSLSNKGGAIWSDHDLGIATGAGLNNDAGTVQASRDLRLSAAQTLSNVGGVIEAVGAGSALSVRADRVDNTGRIVNVGAGATEVAGASAIVNSGVLAGNGGLLLSARTLHNQAAGAIVAGKAMELGVLRQLTNQGKISGAGTLRFDQAGATFTNSGKVVAGAASSLRAAAIVNDGGQIATASGSGADLTLTARGLSNHDGAVFADRHASLAIAGALDNNKGTVQANQDLRVSAGGALDNGGGVIEAIHADSALALQAAAIGNAGGRIVNVGGGNTSVSSAGELVSSGLIAGNGDLVLSAQTLRNQMAGSIVAGKALELAVRQQLVNQGNISSGSTLRFTQTAADFTNSGKVVSGAAATIHARDIVNDGGQIATTSHSGADLMLSARSMSNHGGGIFSDRDANLAIAGALSNASGTIQSAKNSQVSATGALSNDGGVIEAGVGQPAADTLTLRAASIGNNGGGRIVNVGTGTTTVTSASEISSGGQIAGNGDLFLGTQTLRNQTAGAIAAGKALELGVHGLLANQGKISSTGTLRFDQPSASLVNSGKVVAGAAVSIHATSVVNDSGQIATVTGSGADLSLSAHSVSNRGGGVFADRDARLGADAGFDNASGTIQTARDLRLSAGGALNNDAGVIEAVGAGSKLAIEAGAIGNLGGRIVNVGNGFTSVTSAGDLASSGKIAGNGDLTLGAQTLHNQTAGAIVAGKALELDVLRQLTNQGGISSGGTLRFEQAEAGLSNSGKIVAGAASTLGAAAIVNDGGRIATVTGSGGNITLSARSLSNHGGGISADGEASVIVNGAVNNSSGAIQAGKNVQLASLGALSNDGGAIEAAGSLSVQAAAIGNAGGRIVNVGTGATSVSSAGELASSGHIAGNGDLSVNAQTLRNQTTGSIVAGKAMALNVLRQVANQGGISSGAALRFDQAEADFTNSGKVAAGGAASIRAANIVNDGGQIATVSGSAADVALSAHSLSNRGGAIFADRDANLSIGADLDNAIGTIQAGQDLQLSAGGALSNDGGVIEAIHATGTLTVRAAEIANLGGRIVNVGSGATSVASAGDLVSGGKIAGNGDLTLNAQTLHNLAAGSIAAGKALELGVLRQLNNEGSIGSGGALRFDQAAADFTNSGKVVAGATSRVRAASIVNDGGQIATATGSAADLTLSARSLSNRGGAIVADRGTNLGIDGAMDNTSGTLQAGKDLQLAAGGMLRNDGGVIEAVNAASTLDLQAVAIANAGGRIVNAGVGVTNVASQSGVANSGVIAGNGALNLTAQSLQNTLGGAIVAGRALELGVGQQLANLGGTISSGGTLRFHQAAANFSNSGQVVAGGDIDIVAAQLNNDAGRISTAAGSRAGIALATQTLSNHGGKIVADGDAALASVDALDNTQGTLQAGANLALTAGGALSNDGGLIEATGAASTLTLRGQSVNNGDGRIQNAGGGASAIVSQAGIVNHGAIATHGDLTLQGRALQNGAAGSIAAGSNLNLLLTQQLSNQGSINSNGTLSFNQAGAELVNGGLIISGGNATLNLRRIDNQGGSIATGQGSGAALSVNSQALNNQGGKIAADGDLRVATQALEAAGAMSAGRDLALTTVGDYTHGPATQLHANRDLSLNAGGTLSNTGKLEAVGRLTLTAGQVSNQAGAQIQGRDVTIATSGTLGNAGEIQGADTLRIVAGGVNNSDSLVGGKVSITAQTLNNTGAVALLGATDGMGLWLSKELNNTAGATIYSAGALAIAADQARDANADLVNHTATVNNLSSTIEAAGDLELTVGTVNNIREGVTVQRVKTVDETTTMTMPSWWSLNAGDAGGNHHQFLTTSSNYQAYEVYFVNPADILEQSTVVTPDGNMLTRVVLRTHANDSVFYSALGSYAGGYGKRARITASEGAKVLYYTERQDGQLNPDQGGTLQGVSNYAQVNDWSASTLTLSNQYGSCSTNCVRLVSQLDYNDPTHTILRATEIVLPGAHDTDGYELRRTAHHTAVDEQLAPGAGAAARILSGGNMRVVLGQTLNNQYGDIMAGGAYLSTGGDTNNTGTTLYRTHSFDGVRQYANAPSNTYTGADISEQIGEIRGVISGGRGVYISGRSFNNIDASAGAVGNVRAGFTVLGGASDGAAAIGALNGGGAHIAAVAGGVGGSGNASQAATAGEVGGAGTGGHVAAADSVGASGAVNTENVDGGASGSGHISRAEGAGHADGSGNANRALTTGGLGARALDGNASVSGKSAGDALKAVRLGGVTSASGASATGVAPGLQAANAGRPGGPVGVIKVAPTGLSKHNPDPNGRYLFETRPQFANLADWIGSDYLLQALKMNPEATQKRLGDAFYEQKLVREQLAELTGRAIGGGATSDEKYQELMRSAVGYAEAWNLRPGIALTADQVARLTSDIVWLESQRVSLPDGSVQNVLVPKVYLAHLAGGSVKPGGALVTGDSVVVNVDNLLNRGGSIDGATGRTLLVSANDLINQGGAIKGNEVVLQAGRDLINKSMTATQRYTKADNHGAYTALANQASIVATGALSVTAGRDVADVGGRISAGGSAGITAGRDLSFTTARTGSSFEQIKGGTSMIDSSVGNQLSALRSSTDLMLSAGRDLTLSGTQVAIGTSGKGDGLLLAGRTLSVGAVSDESNSDHHSDEASKTYSKAIHNNQSVVGSNIGATGALALAAGVGQTGSLDITASGLASNVALGLSASGDIRIGSAQESHLSDTASTSSSNGFLKKSSINMADYNASTLAIGSGLAGDTVTLNAGRDIVIVASQVTAQGALALSAGRDLSVTTATASHSESHFLETKKSGLTLDLAHGIGYLNAADRADRRSDGTSEVGSVLSGGSVTAISGRDTLIRGGTVVADRDLTLLASRNLSIVSAQDTLNEGSASNSKRSGMIGSVGQPAVGSVKSSHDATSAGVTQVASQVASLGGDVTLRAGEQYRQTSSQVLAPGGDIDIGAKKVLIDAAFDTTASTQHSAASRTAIGGSANIPVLSSVQGIIGMAKAAKDTSSGRMQGLAAITAAMQAQDAVNGVANVANTMKNGTGIKISISLGTSKSESTAAQSASMGVGSKIAAAGDVRITATGGGKESDLTAIGGDISAGGQVDLRADHAVALLAAQNTASQHNNNSSSGFNVGVGYAFGGAQNGFTLDVSANKGRGRADGNDISYSNTHVSGAGGVSLQSGGDTTLKGAVVSGKTVRADVGGNLSIESLQDSSTYASKQSSVGLGLSVCLPPFCYGASSASLSASKTKVNGDFLRVTEQSGIKSDDGGFQIKVGGKTDLTGAVISSGQSAVQRGLNSLSTGSLSHKELVNQDAYQASGYSLSATVSGNLGNQPAPAPLNKEDAKKAADAAGPKPNATGGFGSASGSQNSLTQSGISGGALTVGDGGGLTGIKRDVTSENAAARSGTLAKAWNGQQLMKEVQAQMTITQAFSAQAPKAIATLADNQSRDLLAKAALAPSGSAEEKALKDEAARWGEGGAYRIALHSVSGALLGGIGGAAGAATISSAVERLDALQAQTRSVLEAQGMNAEAARMLAQGLAQATSIGIGAVVGGGGGAAASLATDTNNRQLHESEKARLAELQQFASPEKQKRLADAACALVQCAGGLADSNPDKAALQAQQERGSKYTDEIKALQNNGLFTIGLETLLTNYVDSTIDYQKQLLARTGQGAYNLVRQILSNGPNRPPLTPMDLPSEFGGPDGPTPGTGGALAMPPMPLCIPGGGCVLSPGTVLGWPGYVPPHAIFSENSASSGENKNDKVANTSHEGSGGSGSVNNAPPLDQAASRNILSIEKGVRPDPSTYLSQKYISEHLAEFDSGATRFMTEENLNKYGIGQRDKTSFVMPKQEANLLLDFTKGNPRAIEEALGLPKNFLDTNKLVRIDIPKPSELNLRIPSGNEAGANDLWLPGGKLPNGNLEAVIDVDNISAKRYYVTHMKIIHK